MSKFPLLQSGFVSISEDGLKKPDLTKDSTLTVALFKSHRLSDNYNYYSSPVIKLYNTWAANPDILKDFDFREKLLKAAIVAFKTPSMYMWLKLQNDKTNLSATHVTFIEETLTFVATGKRNIQPCQWILLLDPVTVSNEISIDIDKWFDRASSSNDHIKLPGLITSLIGQWVTHPSGFEDLLLTMYIIFGNRPYTKDVSNKEYNILN